MAEKTIPSSCAPCKEIPPQAFVLLEFLADGTTPVVSSLRLAEHFEIRHHHVMRDIKAVINKVPESFTATNFGFSEYTDSTGRTLPCYLLSRDAFTLLAMGYNSARALAWKLKYIAAFNALEAAVRENARTAALAAGTQAGYALSRLQKIRLTQVVYYRRKGLGIQSIAKLLDVHGREVSHLLRVGAALGRLAESRTLKPTAVANVVSREERAKGTGSFAACVPVTQPERKKGTGV